MKKRIGSLLLAAILVVAMVPATAFASPEDDYVTVTMQTTSLTGMQPEPVMFVPAYDVIKPIAGMTPVNTFTVGGDALIAGKGYWYNMTDNIQNYSGTFEKGKIYRFYGELALRDGYCWPEMGTWFKIPAIVNGEEANLDLLTEGDLHRIWKDFVCEPTPFAPEIYAHSVDKTVTVGDPVEIHVSAWGVDLHYQWYQSNGSFPTMVGEDSNSFTIESANMAEHNDSTYFCVVSNDAGSITSQFIHITVVGKAGVAAPVITKQPQAVDAAVGDTVTFSVTATGEGLHYQWHQVDAGIPVTVGTDSSTYTIESANINDHNCYDFYCVVTNDGGSATSEKAHLTVSENAAPKPRSFSDVPADAWYAADVQKAVELGLVEGKSPSTYCPNDNLTYAEAVKLAVCMYQLYTTGETETYGESNPWYEMYVEMAEYINIIDHAYEWKKPATRADYMEIFSKALPADGFEPINNVPDGSIPDVPMDHPQAEAIYKLYRAGILEGSGDQHLCNPNANIKRSEVAAILTRMMDPNARRHFEMK